MGVEGVGKSYASNIYPGAWARVLPAFREGGEHRRLTASQPVPGTGSELLRAYTSLGFVYSFRVGSVANIPDGDRRTSAVCAGLVLFL